MKQFILCLALLCPFVLRAQPKPLSVGDTLPPAIFKKLLASSQHTINPVLLKNSFVILDFWATWCPACIRETPALNSLQQQFSASLQIIMVANEPSPKIKSFLAAHKNINASSLSFLTANTLLKQYFPHRYLPHQIWLAPGGVVQAITGSGNASQQSISSWLAGNKPSFRLKADADPVNTSQPLFFNGNGAPQAYLRYRSQWAGRLPGRGGSSGTVTDSGLTRRWFINRPMLSLYQEALGFPSGLVLLELNNPSSILLLPNATEQHKDSCLFTYELTVPAGTPMQKQKALMVNDYNSFFNLNGRMENRLFTCWAIRSSTTSLALLQQPLVTDASAASEYWQLSNASFQTFIDALNTGYSPGPQNPYYINETSITGNINISIPLAAFSSQQLLQQALSAYGLTLVKTQKWLNVFVLSANPGSNL